MTRTITYTLRGKKMTYNITERAPTIDPIVARAIAQIAANDACALYEKATQAAAIAPDDEILQREMQDAYSLSIRACDHVRKLRQQ